MIAGVRCHCNALQYTQVVKGCWQLSGGHKWVWIVQGPFV